MKKLSTDAAIKCFFLLFCGGGGVLLLYTYFRVTDRSLQFMFYVLGGISFLLGLFYLYLGNLTYQKPVNFFLYHKKRKEEIPLNELTWEVVEKNFTPYFNLVVKSSSRRLIDRLFDGTIPAAYALLLPPFFIISFASNIQDAGQLEHFKHILLSPTWQGALQKVDLWDSFLLLTTQLPQELSAPLIEQENCANAIAAMKEKLVDYIKNHIDDYC